jgi:hypothetical protein
MAKLFSVAGYAAHRRAAGLPGGTTQAVGLAIRDGRIDRRDDGLIDAELADQQWRERTQYRADFHGHGPVPDLVVAKRKRVAADVALKVQELARRRGDLVDRDDAERKAQQTGRALRDALIDGIPTKHAAELFAIDNVAELKERLSQIFAAELDAHGFTAPLAEGRGNGPTN